MTRPLAERLYDLAERAFICGLGASIVWRFWPSLAGHPFNVLLVASELAAVVMILLRRRAQRLDMSPYAILIALVGTTGGLLVRPGGAALIPEWIGGLVMIAGALLNISAKLSLARSFGVAAANRGVKRSGPYRFLRHPMYAGYIVTQVGFLLTNPTLWNLAVYAAAWTAQLLRIAAEEKVLGEDERYRDYARAVRFRLAPGLY